MRLGFSLSLNASRAAISSSGDVSVSGTFTEGSDINLLADENAVGAGASVEFFGGADGTTSISTDASGPPWTAVDSAVEPGAKLYRIKVDGGDYSAGTSLTVSAQAPTLTEPDASEQIQIGVSFSLEATTFDDSVTTGVSFRVTGPGGYDQTFAGTLATGTWSYSWNTAGLTAGSYSVTATRTGAWGSVSSGAVSCTLQAAPAFVGFATATNDSTADRTPSISSLGMQLNDVQLLHIGSRVPGTLSVTVPAGWTKIPETERIVSAALDVCYWKRWTPGDDETPTVTLSAAGALWNVTVTVWRGCKTTGNPYTVTPVRTDHAAPAGPPYVLTNNVLGSDPGTSSTTVWAIHSNDDNTLNGETRGALVTSYNISNGASMAVIYEAGVNSASATLSVTQSTNGPDTARIHTIALAA